MRTKVSTILVEHMRRWGVTDVFGIPGKSVTPLLFELENQGLRFVLSRHESGGGYAAAGYSMLKKTIGVAVGTSGPGGTNLLTAAGQAKAYHVPLLIITGHPSMSNTGKSQGQDSSPFGTDLVKMFEAVTLFSARVDRADLFPLYLRHAIEKACTGERGPVHLSIPFDVFLEETESFYYPLPTHIPPLISPDVDKLIPLLNAAKRPVLFLGKGVASSGAYDEVRIVAEHWGIPVTTTPGGKGAFPTKHPLSLGAFGLGGNPQATEYLRSGVDLMIVVGTSLSDMSLAGFTPAMYPQQIIQFDISITFAGKSIPAPTKVVLGDAKWNLQRLIENAKASPKSYDFPAPAEAAAAESSVVASGFIPTGAAIRALRSALPEDSILFGDDGSHTFYAIRDYDIYKAGTFFFDDVFGAMGHAIGYAIGAKAAAPDKTIVCLTGDGCTMMQGTEIGMAVNNRIPVIFVIINNGRLDMVDKGMAMMALSSGHSVGSIYETPLNAAQFAQSLGAKSYCCHTAAEIVEAVRVSLDSDGPTVIEVVVDPLEIPPITSRVI
jgi:acetolactate synthase I/II/III large subunit